MQNKQITKYFEYNNQKICVYNLTNKNYICKVYFDNSIHIYISNKLPLYFTDNKMILISSIKFGIKLTKYVK